jgi:hypothetical protein
VKKIKTYPAVFTAFLLALFACFNSCGRQTTVAINCVNGCPSTPTTGPQGPQGPDGTVGQTGGAGATGQTGASCSVDPKGLVTCGTTTYQLPAPQVGATGRQGDTGLAGQNGYSMVFSMTEATAAQCQAGGSIIVLAEDTNRNGVLDPGDSDFQTAVVCNGVDGATGSQGVQGVAGQQGQQGAQGVQGQQGIQGAAGASFTSADIIQPCTASSSPWKEVLLCLPDGNILADFSDNASGLDTRLSLIPPGTYQDTDNSGCVFNVAASGSGLSVSWGAGSNQYATWPAGAVYCGP